VPDRPPTELHPEEGAEHAPARVEPELRLHDRKAYVGFQPTPIGEGIRVADFAMRVPEINYPFDISGGAATRYQRKRCTFGYLTLEIDALVIEGAAKPIQAALADRIDTLTLSCRPDTLEGSGTLLAADAPPTPFTFRVGFEADAEAVVAVIFDVRLYAKSPVPAPMVAPLLARAVEQAKVLPGSRRRGAAGFSFSPLPDLLRRVVPTKGFRIPDVAHARLEGVDVTNASARLRFAEGAAPPGTILDNDLLLATEGMRAFAEGEALLEKGDLDGATRYYARAGEAPDAHPFAAERLLGLLAADSEGHDLALDVAAALLQRRPRAATPLWVEAVIYAHRSNARKACDKFLELARASRDRNHDAAAFCAYVAAARIIATDDPGSASRALQEALVLKPDDLPAITLLAEVADKARDDTGAVRAYRRIAALARDNATAGRAQVRLGHLILELEGDAAAARLHYDAALRHTPDDVEALLGLADVCERSGEYLRAIRCLDRVRDRESSKLPDPAAAEVVGHAALAGGRVWEEGLNHEDNALLRYREAVRLLPKNPEAHLRLAALSDRLGRTSEALDGFRTTVDLIGPNPPDATLRKLAHRAHRALAAIARDRLHAPLEALQHLEAAVGFDESDASALSELVPVYRAAGRLPELARASERLAKITGDPKTRAQLWLEAGTLYRERLGSPDDAERCLRECLLADPDSLAAIGALADIAQAAGDTTSLASFLARQVELTPPGNERVALLRRLALAAREGSADVAAQALENVLASAPDDAEALSELSTLHRRRGDWAALTSALRRLAEVAEKKGDLHRAVEALRDLAKLSDERFSRPAEALDALDKARTLAPEDAGILLAFADVSLRCEHPAAAREAYRAVFRLLPPTATDAERVRLYGRLAEACEGAGDLAGAVDAARAASALAPLDDAIGERLDGLFVALGRERDRAELASARARAFAASGRRDRAAVLYAQGGETRRRLGETEAALRDFRAAIEADPQGPSAGSVLDFMAEMSEASGEPAEAAGYLARRAAMPGPARVAARALARASALVRDSEPERARGYLAAATAKDPGFAPAHASLAEALAAAGDPAEALRHAEAAIAVVQGDPDALDAGQRTSLHRIAASAARALGDVASARKQLAAYVARSPADTAALAELCALHREAGATDALAESLAELVLRLSPAESVEPLRELAGLYDGPLFRRRDAVDLYRRVLTISPDDVGALRALAGTLTNPGEAGERAQVLGRLARQEPDPKRASAIHFSRGEALVEAGEVQGAVEAFDEASRTGEDPAPALEHLARAAASAGDVDRELAALARRADLAAQRQEPGAADRFASLGTRLSTMGLSGPARAALTRALDFGLPPEMKRTTLSFLAALSEEQRDFEAAAKHLGELADALTGTARAEALVRRAKAFKERGDLASSVEALRGAVEAAPGYAEAASLLKKVALETGDFAAYATLLSSELAQARSDPPRMNELALELGKVKETRLDDAPGAEAAYRHAAEAAPNDLRGHEALLRMLTKRGATAEALDEVETVARLLPDGPSAAARLAEGAKIAREALRDDRRALRLARRAVELVPENVEALFVCADLLYLQGATTEALGLYRRLEAKLDFDHDRERSTEAALRLSELYLDAGDRAKAVPLLIRVLDSEPTSATAADRLYAALLPDDPTAAIERYEAHARSLSEGSRSAALFFRMAEDARRLLHDPRAAIRLLEQARKVSDDPAAVDSAMAAVLREANEGPALAEVLARMAGRLGDDPKALATTLTELAAIQVANQEYREGAESLQRAEAALVTAGDRVGAAARARARAEILRDRLNDPAAAEVAFCAAINDDPEDLAAIESAISLRRGREDAKGEAELIEKAIPLMETNAPRVRSYLRLADLNAGPLESLERVEAFLQSALSIDPQSVEARNRREQLLRRLGRNQELAESLSERAQGLTGADRAALFVEAANHFEAAGDVGQAAQVLLDAIEASPDDLALAARCSDLLERAGRPEVALIDRSVFERDPSLDGSFRRELSRLESGGDLTGRAGLLERRAEATGRNNPQQAALHLLDAARCRRESGDSEKAHADETAAYRLDPSNDRLFALIVARIDSPAEKDLDKLLLLRAKAVPAEASTVHRLRAQAFLARGKRKKAAESLDAALELEPKNVELLSLRAQIAADEDPRSAAEFDEALLADPDAVRAAPRALVPSRLRLAEAALASGDGSRARALIEPGLPSMSAAEEHRASELLERAYEMTGDRASLLRIKLARAQQASGADRERLLTEAAGAAPDEGSALPALTQLAQLRPSDTALNLRLARALAPEGRHAEQADALERAAEATDDAHERSGLFLEAAAVAAELLKDEPRARDLRAAALNSDPKNLDAVRAALPDLRGEGDATRLIEALSTLYADTADTKERALLRIDLAAAKEKAGDKEGASSIYRAILDEGPRAIGFHTAAERAQKLFDATGDPRGAAMALAALAESAADPTMGAFQLLEAAELLDVRADDAQGAAIYAARAAKLAPEAPQPHAFLAKMWARRGSAQAEADAIAAEVMRVETGPKKGKRLLRMAELLAGLGRGGDAAAAYEMALDADSNLAEAHLALAARDEKSGAATSALAHLEAAQAAPALNEAARLGLDRRIAVVARAAGDTQKAEAAFRKLFDQDPADSEAFAALTDAYRARGANEQLLALIEERLDALMALGEESDGERAGLYCDRADIHRVLSRDDAAEQSYRAALELDVRSARALTGIRELAEANGEPLPHARALEAELEITGESPDSAPRWFTLGGLYLDHPDVAASEPARKAADALRRARDRAEHLPGGGDLLLRVERRLVEALHSSGSEDEAVTLAESLLADAPDDLTLLSTAADAAHALGDRGKALGFLEAILDRTPDDRSVLDRFEAEAGDDPFALSKAIERRLRSASETERPALLARLAGVREQSGDLRAARSALEDAFAADPAGTSFERLRDLLLSQGEYARAAEVIETRAQKGSSGSEQPALLADLARLRRDALRDVQGAVRAWEQALQLNPELSQGKESLAKLYRESGRSGDALRLLGESANTAGSSLSAVEDYLQLAREQKSRDDVARGLKLLARRKSGPEAADLFLQLGVLEEQRGRLDDAVAAFDAAAAADPSNRPALLRLARLKMATGDAKGAISALARAADGETDAAARAQLNRQIGDLWMSAGEVAQALTAFEAASTAGGDAASWRGRLGAALALKQDRAIADAARGLIGVSGVDAVADHAGRVAEAFLATQAETDAVGVARLIDPVSNPALTEALARAAWSRGDRVLSLQLEESALGAQEFTPEERARRLRSMAAAAKDAGDVRRAIRLSEQAFVLVPPTIEEVAEQARLCEAIPEERSKAVSGYALMAQRRLTDRALLEHLIDLARGTDEVVRARNAEGILRFLYGMPAPAFVAPWATITKDLRARLHPAGIEQGPWRLVQALLCEAIRHVPPAPREGEHPIAAGPLVDAVTGVARLLAHDTPRIVLASSQAMRVSCRGGSALSLTIGPGIAWEAAGAGLAYAVGQALEATRYGLVEQIRTPLDARHWAELVLTAAGRDAGLAPTMEERVLIQSISGRLPAAIIDLVVSLPSRPAEILGEFDFDGYVASAEEAAQRIALVASGDLASALWVELRANPAHATTHPALIDAAFALEAEPPLSRLARFALGGEVSKLRNEV
jgi:tetratricopeptide (TPR) repeat protein